MERVKKSHTLLVALGSVLLFFYLSLHSMVDDSPTMDEQNHLARGLAFLGTGDPRFSVEHPPLVNVLGALPVHLLMSVDLPIDHPSWEQPEGWYAFADNLLWVRNREQASLMVFLARMPIVWLTLGLGLVGFRLGRSLWGGRAGPLALVLLLFDPNVMAHGRYMTTDLGGAFFLFVAAISLWRFWSSEPWRWRRLAITGAALGLALGSKMSNLAFLPIFAGMAVMPVHPGPWRLRGAVNRMLKLGASGGLAVVVLWAVYGFEWGPLALATPALGWLNTVSGPMPTYWAGIEQVLQISGGGRPSFLLGQFSTEGFWYYFPVAFAAKTPLPSIVAFLTATWMLMQSQQTRKKAAFLLLPPLAYFALSTQSALNIGYRHLLPTLPFFYLLAAGLAGRTSWLLRWPAPMERLFGRPIVALASVMILINLWIHPHYLSYFNLPAGGPANGYKVLIDSNVDWGQDLLRLQRWSADNNVRRLKLSWFGTADPALYEMSYDPLPGLPRHFDLWWDPPFDPSKPEEGTYAISVSNLWELPLEEKTVFRWFREREPDDRVGYSIHIYEVKAE